MIWRTVDGVRDRLDDGSGHKPSRKAIYAMVKAGMRVSRRGESGRRMWFCDEWVDEFLIRRSQGAPHGLRAIDRRDDAAIGE